MSALAATIGRPLGAWFDIRRRLASAAVALLAFLLDALIFRQMIGTRVTGPSAKVLADGMQAWKVASLALEVASKYFASTPADMLLKVFARHDSR